MSGITGGARIAAALLAALLVLPVAVPTLAMAQQQTINGIPVPPGVPVPPGAVVIPVQPPPVVIPKPPQLNLQPPDMHSYKPYSTLQYGFRPEAPFQRGIRPENKRPQVIMPVPQAPLIEYGKGNTGAGVQQRYIYCAPNRSCP